MCFVSFISYFLLDSSNIPLSHVYCSHALLFYKMMRFFLLLLTLFPPSFVCLCVSQSVRRVHSFIHSLQRLSSILHWFWRTILVLLWPFIEIFIGFLFSSFFLVPRIPVPKAPSIEERGEANKKRWIRYMSISGEMVIVLANVCNERVQRRGQTVYSMHNAAGG